MEHSVTFDLPEFMLSNFSRVELGGSLFEQWPAGIRFEIGIDQVSRAVKLFESTFVEVEDCILVSQDWRPYGRLLKGRTSLFNTPGLFPVKPTQIQTIEISPFEDTPYRLTWTRSSPRAFDAALMFQAVANREQPGSPKIDSAVYVISPSKKVIMHMYDDRGLDVIASQLETLRPLFESYDEWILDNQRHRVEFRFRLKAQKPSERRASS